MFSLSFFTDPPQGRLPLLQTFIYGSLTRRLLTAFLPIFLIGSAPVRFLFNHSDWLPFLGLGIAIIVVWVLLNIVWNLGLNLYESASS